MGDRAVLEQRHLVGEQDGRGTVCDNDSGRVGEHVAQGFLDQRLGVHVERGQRVVEHEDARIGQHRTGEREPLPLPTGQAHPLLADAGVEAERKVSHELRLSDLDRCVDLLLRRVRVAEREVLADRHREQRGILERRRNDLAQHRQRKLAYVDAVDQHGAFGDVAQARDQSGEHRLARAGRADKGDRLPRLDDQVQMTQHPFVTVGEPEPCIAQFEPAAGDAGVARAALDGAWRVEDLGDSVCRGHGLLQHGQQEAEGGDRPDQVEHEGDEGDERAERDVAVADGMGAHREHDHQRGGRDDFEQRPEPRHDLDLAQLDLTQFGRLGVESVEHVLLASERLDHAKAERRLLHLCGDVAGLVLSGTGGFAELALVVQVRADHRPDRDQHHQTERPVHPEQDRRDDHDLNHVENQQDRPEADEATHHAEVVHHPGEQLARLPTAVEAHRQHLQARVQLLADVVLDAGARGLHQPPADHPQRRFGDTEKESAAAEDPQTALVVVRDRAVDHRPRHERDRDRAADGGQRDDEHDDHPGAVRAQVRQQADQRVAPQTGAPGRGDAGFAEEFAGVRHRFRRTTCGPACFDRQELTRPLQNH